MRKKSLAILAALVMVFSAVNTTVFALEFSDMPDDWSTTALENAVANGLLIGTDGKILPKDNLTRAQMTTIVNRAFGDGVGGGKVTLIGVTVDGRTVIRSDQESLTIDGEIIETMSKGEVYYRENLLNTVNASGDALLMEPLRAGTTWILSDGRERTISSVSKVVPTPSGSFLCIEVVTQGEFDRVTDYYAKDVGLVKSVFTSGGNEVSSSLKEIEVNASQLQTINLYYPNINDGKLYASGHIEMQEGETIPANFKGVGEIT